MKIIDLVKLLWLMVVIIVLAGCVTNYPTNPDQLTPVTMNGTGGQTSLFESQSAAIQGSVSHSMSLTKSVKKNPGKILIYKTLPPDVSKSRLEEFAEIFHVKGKYGEGSGGIAIQTEDLVSGITIGKASGTVNYLVQNRPNDALDSPDKLPSDEEAVKIATQFLKDNNLYPDGAQPGKAEREYAKFSDNQGNWINRNGEVIVWFGRKLNDLDVEGTQLYVNVGGSGDIIGYYSNWREYTPAGEYTIKTPEIAFEDLKQEGIKTELNNPSISITGATLAYRTRAGAYEEEYLEPIWEFNGIASSDKGESRPVSKFIPALSEESVKSFPSS